MVSTQDSESCDPGSNPGRTFLFAGGIETQAIGAQGEQSICADTLAEWLRRVIRNHMGSSRAGSNPAGVVDFASFVEPKRLWSRGYDVRFPTVRPGFDSRQAHVFAFYFVTRANNSSG